MRYSISNTAEYGDLTRGKRVIDDAHPPGDEARSSTRSSRASSRASGSPRTRPARRTSSACARRARTTRSSARASELRSHDGLDRPGVLSGRGAPPASSCPRSPGPRAGPRGAPSRSRPRLSSRPRQPSRCQARSSHPAGSRRSRRSRAGSSRPSPPDGSAGWQQPPPGWQPPPPGWAPARVGLPAAADGARQRRGGRGLRRSRWSRRGLLLISVGFLGFVSVIGAPFGIFYSRKGKQAVDAGRRPSTAASHRPAS